MTREKADFTAIRATKTYDAETSLSLAAACDLAYKSENTCRSTAKRWGFPGLTFVDIKKGNDIDTQAFVMSNDKDIVVVFRGTDGIKDWLSNFQAVSDPGPMNDTKAHEGFQDALYPAVIRLTTAIDDRRRSEQRIWVTGHSLGGALASLFAGMLIENKIPIYGLYTFASPRPGNHSFAELLDAALEGGPHYRVVNAGDIVPHVPPEPFYSHSGKRIILKHNARKTDRKEWTAIRKKVFSLLMDIRNIVKAKTDIIGNHVLHDNKRGYLVRLKADLRRSKK
jgi:triacylglycerol lipase